MHHLSVSHSVSLDGVTIITHKYLDCASPYQASLGGSVDVRPMVIRRLPVQPPPGQQHSFIEIDHEIFSMVILSFPLIQEEQLSVSG